MRWLAEDALAGPEARQRQAGGLRIIYLYLPDSERVVFIDVYDKDEAEDLTPEERKEFTEVAQAIRLDFQRQT